LKCQNQQPASFYSWLNSLAYFLSLPTSRPTGGTTRKLLKKQKNNTMQIISYDSNEQRKLLNLLRHFEIFEQGDGNRRKNRCNYEKASKNITLLSFKRKMHTLSFEKRGHGKNVPLLQKTPQTIFAKDK
jgi:hypothetical protein